MNNFLFGFLILALALGFYSFPAEVLAAEDTLLINVAIGECNNNGACEAWETIGDCPNDCPESPAPACDNDEICESGETTENCPNDCPEQIISGGESIPDTSPPLILNLGIQPSLNSAVISWETNKFSLSKVYWGNTLDYEAGSLSETAYLKKHYTKITNLFPGVEYFFKIEIKDLLGNENEIKAKKFKTLALPDAEAPANVRNLKVEILNDSIILKWENPLDFDFEAVRVLKSEKFYPAGPFAGELVYDGGETKAKDGDIKKGIVYYYSVFSRDKNGNYSSGAIISAKAGIEVEFSASAAPAIKTPPSAISFPKIKELYLSDFDFIQDNKKISFTENRININGDKNLKISINYDKVPDFINSMFLTFHNLKNADAEYSFFLSVNKEKMTHETTIAPLRKEGLHPFNITVLDYKNLELKKIDGMFFASVAKSLKYVNKGAFQIYFLEKMLLWIIFAIIILVPAIIIGFKILLRFSKR